MSEFAKKYRMRCLLVLFLGKNINISCKINIVKVKNHTNLFCTMKGDVDVYEIHC